jgi:hypothetical protein
LHGSQELHDACPDMGMISEISISGNESLSRKFITGTPETEFSLALNNATLDNQESMVYRVFEIS